MLTQVFNAVSTRLTPATKRTPAQRAVMAFHDMAAEIRFLNMQARGHSGDINNPVMRELRHQLARRGWHMGNADQGVETELSHAVRIFTLNSETFLGNARLLETMEQFAKGGENLRAAVVHIRDHIDQLEDAIADTKQTFLKDHMKIVERINRAVAYAPRRWF